MDIGKKITAPGNCKANQRANMDAKLKAAREDLIVYE